MHKLVRLVFFSQDSLILYTTCRISDKSAFTKYHINDILNGPYIIIYMNKQVVGQPHIEYDQ